MKNKIKYLLSFLVLGLGLFCSQSFGYDQKIYIDGVTTPILNGGQSASYLYTFQNYGDSTNVCGDGFSCATQTVRNDFGYSLYYNGTIQTNYLYYGCTSGLDCNYSNFGNTYNNSAFGLSLYTGWYAINGNRNYSSNKSSNYGPISVYLGTDSDKGKTFVGVSDIAGSNDYKSPVYGLAKNFLNGLNYLKVSDSDYFRLFFNQNVNLSSPLDGFSPVTLSGSNMTGSYGWEYFYPRGTRTNYGYIIDHGQLYTKYKHFGLFGYGYSYSYILGNSSYSAMSWQDLKFVTVDDSIGDYQQLFGDVSATEFSNLSWNGILVLRSSSYVSRGNDNGVYLLSKNPDNAAQILYEHWSCNTSNLDIIFSGGNGTVGSCIKLDGGFLTYNYDSVSTYVMPFNSTGTIQGINPDSNRYPFVRSIIRGDDLNSSHGYNYVSNNCLYINSTSTCFGFSSNSGVDLREIYLSENPGHGNGDNDWIGGGDNSSLYFSCLGPVYNTPDGLPPYYCYDENGDFNPDRLKNCWLTTDAGDDGLLYEHIFCDIDGQQQEVDIIENGSGTSLVPCVGQCAGWSLSILSGGFTTGYFENYFNSTGYFFKCPYPYSKKLVVLPSLMNLLNGIDVALPINCFISAFEHGKSFDFFDNVGLFDFGPLINGDSSNHKILFRFFDFLLIIWFILFFTFIYKRFK